MSAADGRAQPRHRRRRRCARCARLGIEGVQLKWPNDLVTPQGKLGGILIEMRTESAGPVQVVVGIGLNMALRW